MEQTKRKHPPVRRVFTVALAAVLAVTSLCTVALAASPELRSAVLSFFHMEEPEQVPDKSFMPDGPDISQADIGNLVKAQYIRMEQNTFDRGYSFYGDLIADFEWSEDKRVLQSAKFMEIRDGEMVPVEIDVHTRQLDITYGGIRYQGELYWYIRNGALHAFKGYPFGVDTQPKDQWSPRAVSGRTDVVMLLVSQGRQMDYTETSLLYHLDTGEIEDLFAGVDPDIIADSDGSIWSPGARRVLITGRASAEFPSGREWLYDRESGTLTDVSILGGAGAEFAIFVDDDTLILRVYEYTPEHETETVASWVYDIPSGQAVQTLPPSKEYRTQFPNEEPCGVIPFYGAWCMEIEQDGSTRLINLVTGARTELENFVYQKGMSFQLNPSGNKLLYFMMDPEAEGLGITQLGAINLEKNTFIAFDREGYENLHEESIGWEDDSIVSINARTLDFETQYLILYTF